MENERGRRQEGEGRLRWQHVHRGFFLARRVPTEPTPKASHDWMARYVEIGNKWTVSYVRSEWMLRYVPSRCKGAARSKLELHECRSTSEEKK